LGIQLVYTDNTGTEHTCEYSPDVMEIDLQGKRITAIDLTPLRSATRLQKLRLNDNQLQSVDLSPLVKCASLQLLSLERNNLESINLSPLKSCKDLQTLNLTGNKLQSIDISPLKSSSTSLQVVLLGKNELQNICDAAALASARQMGAIYQERIGK